MPSLSESIITGVVSGILTTAVLFLLKKLFDGVVLPWYRNLVYRGVNISDQWKNEMEFPGGTHQTLIANIKQRAHAVEGDLTITKTRNGQLFVTKTLLLVGEIHDRLLLATIKPMSDKEIAAATLLLEVVGNGSRMRGATSWYDATGGRILQEDVEWT